MLSRFMDFVDLKVFRDVLVDEVLSVSQWASVLKLSAHWRMNRVMRIALNALSCVDRARCEEWLAVLSASDTDRDRLREARTLAIQRISATIRSSSAVRGVRLGRRHKIKEWFRNGLEKLVQRGTYFSDEEEEELGLKTTCKLYRIREDHRRKSTNGGNKKSQANVPAAAERVIDHIDREFRDELEGMEESITLVEI